MSVLLKTLHLQGSREQILEFLQDCLTPVHSKVLLKFIRHNVKLK